MGSTVEHEGYAGKALGKIPEGTKLQPHGFRVEPPQAPAEKPDAITAAHELFITDREAWARKMQADAQKNGNVDSEA